MYCEKCGQPLQETDPFCSHCGARNMYYKPSGNNDPKKRKLLIMLLIFIAVIILAAIAIILWKGLSPKGEKGGESSSAVTPYTEDSSQTASEAENTRPESSESSTSSEESAETSESAEEKPAAADDSAQTIQENITEESESTESEEEPQAEEPDYLPISMTHILSTAESSYLKESDLHYPASSAVDGDPATGWSEDVSGYGESEWIELTFDGTYLVSGMRIAIGLQTDSDRYYNNSRPRELLLTFSDGTEVLADVEDRMGYQTIAFDAPVAARSLKVTVTAVYRGSKYEDTLISEIELY